MLESKQWLEEENNTGVKSTTRTKQVYHLHIPIDTLTVLKALEQLMTPDPKLYNVPFVIAIPVLEPMPQPRMGNNNTNSSHSPWKLTLSLFAHRLLFECLTDHSLRTVMAALDPDTTATDTTNAS
mmetsp:Transcript_1999/g.2317  ORF Transcript_1999/g.2317 Transcript_1999/m.2317 type:complete len:125 (+) Transcript_1999:188-562(+)